ncbi:hypothetical protein D9M69_459780 [compost metagenome]
MLRLIPAWCWASLGGLVLALVVGGAQQIRVSSAQVDASAALRNLADYRTEVAERDRRAALAVLAETKRRQQAAEEIESDAKNKLAQARADAAVAESAADGLRGEVARLRAGRSATCSAIATGERAAGESAVLVLGELLEDADRMAGDLAAALDRSRIAGLACEKAYDSLRPWDARHSRAN